MKLGEMAAIITVLELPHKDSWLAENVISSYAFVTPRHCGPPRTNTKKYQLMSYEQQDVGGLEVGCSLAESPIDSCGSTPMFLLNILRYIISQQPPTYIQTMKSHGGKAKGL